jgi:hypothetical protein
MAVVASAMDAVVQAYATEAADRSLAPPPQTYHKAVVAEAWTSPAAFHRIHLKVGLHRRMGLPQSPA